MKNICRFLCSIFAFLFLTSTPLCGLMYYPDETPVGNYIKPIEVTEFDSSLDSVDCIYVINLDKRPEKWARMKKILTEEGLHINRMSGVNGWELTKEDQEKLSGPYPVRLTPGQIGCLLSHLSIIKDAYDRGFNLIWVMEDDIEILEDIRQLPALIQDLSYIDPDWDIFHTNLNFLDRNGEHFPVRGVDPRPDQALYPLHYYLERHSVAENLVRIHSKYGTASYFISRTGMKKWLYYFSHVYLWTAVDADLHYIPGIREYTSRRDIVTNLKDNSISDTATRK